MRPLFYNYSSRLRFVLADPSTSADFLRSFDLSPADAPTIVIHDTANGDAKHVLREGTGATLSKAAVRRFINRFLYGDVQRGVRDEL